MYDSEGWRRSGLRCGSKTGPAEGNRVGEGGSDRAADRGYEGRRRVNRDDLAEMNGRCTRLIEEIPENSRKIGLHREAFLVNQERKNGSREVHRQGVTDVQAADERTLGCRNQVGDDQGELLRQAARVDRYDDALDGVLCCCQERFDFLDGESSIGLENDIHAGDLVVGHAVRQYVCSSRAAGKGRVGVIECGGSRRSGEGATTRDWC